MDQAFNQPYGPLIAADNVLITGGNFTHTTEDTKTGLELLRDAITPSALHDSGELFDPPKCHPKTRTAVLQEIMDWITCQGPKTRSSLIMWLHGAAGAGKSAIARTIAEMCAEKGYLIGSFFFNRSDSRRNHALSLFPTIAYQMALALPEIKEKLSSIVADDPLICSRSIPAQFTSLIIEPLRDLFDFFSNPLSSRLVIIDGLDECSDRQVPCQILDIIVDGIQRHNLPLLFLVTSRPEHDISHRFNDQDMTNVHARLPLYNSLQANQDIERFLRDKFSDIRRRHPFKGSIPTTPWPTDEVISHLVEKSSGQFVYASTVIKYVQLSRRWPHHQLEIILKLRPARGDRPFAELDSLYTHIFSCVADLDLVLSFIAIDIVLAQSSIHYTVEHIEHLLSMESGHVEMLFCDISSIIEIQEGRRLRFLHASLSDFLLDESRSGSYHINLAIAQNRLVQYCLQFLMYRSIHDPSLSDFTFAVIEIFLMYFCKNSLSSDLQLQHVIFSLSIPHIYQQALNAPRPVIGLHRYLTREFIPEFLRVLKALGKNAEHCYTHHLQSFDFILRQHLEVYYSNMHLTCAVAMVECGIKAFPYPAMPFRVREASEEIDSKRLNLFSATETGGEISDYGKLVRDFLIDPERSGPYMLDGERFAIAARCCWTYLSEDADASRNPYRAGQIPLYLGLSNFLPRAARSDELITCFHRKLPFYDSWSVKGYTEALREILAYLERMGPGGV